MANDDKKKKKMNWGEAWGEARDLMWAHRSRLALGLFLLALNRGAAFVLPFSFGPFVGSLTEGDVDRIKTVTLYLAIATVVQSITSFLLSKILSVSAQHAIMEMRKTVQQHVTRLPTSYFDNTKSGVLISRVMNDPEGIRNLVGTGVTQLIGGIVTIIVAFGFLFWYFWQLTLISLLVLGIFAGVMFFAFAKLRPLFRVRGEITADVTGRLTESMGGIRVVKAYTAEDHEDEIFANNAQRLYENVASSLTGVAAVTAISTVVIGALSIVVMIVGGNAAMDPNNDFDLEALITYIALTGMMASPLINMANIGTQITDAFAGLDRIREIRSMTTEGEKDDDLDALETINGDIVFEDVFFEYEEDKPVLNGVSFEAPAGTTTALVGSSGSGKSTLIGLVMAFHYANSGTITIDGRDITSVKLKDYRSKLGVVMQDNFLFEGTIADNIRYSRPDSTMDEVRQVSKIAHCDEFVDGFEDGFDTVVGERGVKLSGGQRQRVAIARAILADPKLLILDEATASLDSESEAKIQDGLESLREGRTSFVIAHRLSTIQSADQILVLEHGEIVERGTHAELLAIEGRYKQLYDKQYKFEMNRFINPGEEIESEEA
ncbi:MAG: ABC transporter ATP-binding protein [Candidatus Hydrogenedentota bacterium]